VSALNVAPEDCRDFDVKDISLALSLSRAGIKALRMDCLMICRRSASVRAGKPLLTSVGKSKDMISLISVTVVTEV